MRGAHEAVMRKGDGEGGIANSGMHTEDYPDARDILLDKGYQRALEFVRAI